jgi:hypothetical protein
MLSDRKRPGKRGWDPKEKVTAKGNCSYNWAEPMLISPVLMQISSKQRRESKRMMYWEDIIILILCVLKSISLK